jgi:hypothetical protein
VLLPLPLDGIGAVGRRLEHNQGRNGMVIGQAD